MFTIKSHSLETASYIFWYRLVLFPPFGSEMIMVVLFTPMLTKEIHYAVVFLTFLFNSLQNKYSEN